MQIRVTKRALIRIQININYAIRSFSTPRNLNEVVCWFLINLITQIDYVIISSTKFGMRS